MNELKIKGIYKHFKGDYYLVEDTAVHSETKETLGKTKRYVFRRSRSWKIPRC